MNYYYCYCQYYLISSMFVYIAIFENVWCVVRICTVFILILLFAAIKTHFHCLPFRQLRFRIIFDAIILLIFYFFHSSVAIIGAICLFAFTK